MTRDEIIKGFVAGAMTSTAPTAEVYDAVMDYNEEEEVKSYYEGGICPDCGEEIPDDTEDGGECENCGHCFCLDKEEPPYIAWEPFEKWSHYAFCEAMVKMHSATTYFVDEILASLTVEELEALLAERKKAAADQVIP